MKTIGMCLIAVLMGCQMVWAQQPALTKIYFHQTKAVSGSFSLKTTLNPNTPILIGQSGKEGYTLVETDADSLGIVVPSGQTAYLHFKRGQTYYYRIVSYFYGSVFTSRPTTVNAVDPNEFWLNVYLNEPAFRHYILKQESGLQELSTKQ